GLQNCRCPVYRSIEQHARGAGISQRPSDQPGGLYPMTNLTLTAAELGYLKKAFATVFAVFLLICALIQWRYGVTFEIALPRSFSAAMLPASLLFYAFYRWLWRWGKLAKWMGRPVLHGVWLGYIASNYNQIPSQNPLRKKIVFVVRQTYLTLSVQTFTDTQIG